jgi:hypothetical protein
MVIEISGRNCVYDKKWLSIVPYDKVGTTQHAFLVGAVD